MDKTNAIRILDKAHINYLLYDYRLPSIVSALDIATYFNVDPSRVFKTLVTRAKSKLLYVFVIPATSELDLKKAANVVNEKSIEMLPSKELLVTTGYIHGGCSPIAMKKQFTTIINTSVSDFQTFFVNGGKIGYMLELKLEDLSKVIKYQLADVVK